MAIKNVYTLKKIPHKSQVYNTLGNYLKNKEYEILVSDMHNSKMEDLIFIHELVELVLVKHRKISLKAIDKFDIEFEKNRKPGDESEPGDSPSAPYCSEHQVATIIEKLMARILEVDWKEYEKKSIKISNTYAK